MSGLMLCTVNQNFAEWSGTTSMHDLVRNEVTKREIRREDECANIILIQQDHNITPIQQDHYVRTGPASSLKLIHRSCQRKHLGEKD